MAAETITIKMTWETTVPMLVALIERGTPCGRQTAIENLACMAKLADERVAQLEAEQAANEGGVK